VEGPGDCLLLGCHVSRPAAPAYLSESRDSRYRIFMPIIRISTIRGSPSSSPRAASVRDLRLACREYHECYEQQQDADLCDQVHRPHLLPSDGARPDGECKPVGPLTASGGSYLEVKFECLPVWWLWVDQ
jgi:hypothetical protein